MSKFELYNVVLKDLGSEPRVYEFELDDAYFKKIDSPEVEKGKVSAKITVLKKFSSYELNFQINGVVFIPCNRCLDNMEQPISYKEKLTVKFGDEFAEEGRGKRKISIVYYPDINMYQGRESLQVIIRHYQFD